MEHPQFTAPWKKLPQPSFPASALCRDKRPVYGNRAERSVEQGCTRQCHTPWYAFVCDVPFSTPYTARRDKFMSFLPELSCWRCTLFKITSLLVLAWPFHCPTFCNQHAMYSLRLHTELLLSPPQSLQIAPFLPDLWQAPLVSHQSSTTPLTLWFLAVQVFGFCQVHGLMIVPAVLTKKWLQARSFTSTL